MKNLFLTIIAMAMIVSCDNPVSKKMKETKRNVSNTTKAYKELNNMQADIKELQETEPLTKEELKSWLPDEVNGMKRTSYKAGQAAIMQIASVEATYTSNDKSQVFTVHLVDCAGETGASATVGMRMMFSQDIEEMSDTGYKKSVTRKGMNAIEEYYESGNRTTIQLMKDERFYMQATGKNMTVEEAWDAIEELDMDDLG